MLVLMNYLARHNSGNLRHNARQRGCLARKIGSPENRCVGEGAESTH